MPYDLHFSHIEINGCHMAYEGFPHICIGGTITWGERISGMWVPPHVIVPHGANMRETLICHTICIFLIYVYISIYVHIYIICMYVCIICIYRYIFLYFYIYIYIYFYIYNIYIYIIYIYIYI